jgi:hypothetical protein
MQDYLMILISCIRAIRGVLFEFKGCMLAKIKIFLSLLISCSAFVRTWPVRLVVFFTDNIHVFWSLSRDSTITEINDGLANRMSLAERMLTKSIVPLYIRRFIRH